MTSSSELLDMEVCLRVIGGSLGEIITLYESPSIESMSLLEKSLILIWSSPYLNLSLSSSSSEGISLWITKNG